MALWASARVFYSPRDFPTYGGPAWRRLHPDDPKRYAAVMEAAELWRRHQAEQQRLDHLAETDPHTWLTEVTADANAYARSIAGSLARTPTFAELQARRAAYPPAHEVRAAPGWPAVAIPGCPGWSRHLIDGRQTDLPNQAVTRESRETAA